MKSRLGLAWLAFGGVVGIGAAGGVTGAQAFEVAFEEASEVADTLREQELQLVTIVARRATDPMAFSGSNFVLDEPALAALNHTDVHRMLQAVPGVYVRDEEGLGLFPNIGIRGANSGRSAKITILEDGLPAAMAPYASPASYVFPTAARMRGIEVLKGPESLRHGPYTVGGTINLLSTAIPQGSRRQLEAETGSFSGQKVHATWGGSEGAWGALLEVFYKDSDGFARIDRSNRTAGHELFEQVAKIRWQGSAGGDREQSFELKLVHSEEVADQSYVGLTDIDQRRTPDRRYGLTELDTIDRARQGATLRHVLSFQPDLRLATALYTYRNTRDFARLTHIAGEDITRFVERANTDAARQRILDGAFARDIRHQLNFRTFDATGISSELHGVTTLAAQTHEIWAGVRFHEDLEDRLQPIDVYEQIDGKLAFDRRIAANASNNRLGEARALSAWFVDHVKFERVNLTATLRYEDIETRERRYSDVARSSVAGEVANELSRLTAGVGLTAKLTDKLSWLVGIHQGFAPPGSGATAGQRGEESVNSELGIRFRHATTQFDLVGFFSDYANSQQTCTLANPCAGGIIDGTQQTGAAEVYGLEFSASTLLLDRGGWRVPLRMNWTWSEGEVTRDSDTRSVLVGDNLPYLPKHVGSATVTVERGRWSLNLQSAYIGAQCVDSLCNRLGIDNTYRTTESYWLTDVAARWQVNDSTSVYLRVENLLDDRFLVSRGAAGARSNMPRYAGFGFRLEF